MIGLKRGRVAICEHREEWSEIAAQTIQSLKEIFGDVAVDIQHIGSTAIRHIKAKPIIDIAVGVRSFEALRDILPRLDNSGIYQQRHNRFSSNLLYVIEDADSIRTHQVHILIHDSPQWGNYVDFRDCMNLFPDKAKEYEELKIQLVDTCDNIQTVYTDGKSEYMQRMLAEAKQFAASQPNKP